MADFVKFHSDVTHVLSKYIDETNAALKEFEKNQKEAHTKEFSAALYKIRLEQYYSLKEIQNLLKVKLN